MAGSMIVREPESATKMAVEMARRMFAAAHDLDLDRIEGEGYWDGDTLHIDLRYYPPLERIEVSFTIDPS